MKTRHGQSRVTTRSLLIEGKEEVKANKEKSTKREVVENFKQEQLHQGAQTSDNFCKENNMLLVFTYQNLHGAHLYQDENGNYYFRIGVVTIPKPEG